MSKNGWLQGKSIIDLLWEDLDNTMDLLMAECQRCGVIAGGHPHIKGRKYCNEPQPEDYDLEYSVDEYRGRAQGVAYALALMSNPYLRNVEEVRKLAKERYDQRSQGQAVTPLKTRPGITVSDEE
jgi:hypothetical protein